MVGVVRCDVARVLHDGVVGIGKGALWGRGCDKLARGGERGNDGAGRQLGRYRGGRRLVELSCCCESNEMKWLSRSENDQSTSKFVWTRRKQMKAKEPRSTSSLVLLLRLEV